MSTSGERGATLLEAIVAVAIVAISLGALLGAGLAAVHRFGADPVQIALEQACQRELRIAVDLLKYQGSSIQPTTIATTLPLASASPLAVQLSIATSSYGAGVHVTLSATSQQPPRQASLTTTIANRAPLPGSAIAAPGTVPEPTGAP